MKTLKQNAGAQVSQPFLKKRTKLTKGKQEHRNFCSLKHGMGYSTELLSMAF